MSTETNTAKPLRAPELETNVKAARDGEPEGPVAVEDLEKLAAGVDATEKRRRKMTVLLLAAVLVLIGGGYFAWRAFQYEDTDDAQIDGHIMPLSARITGQIQEVKVVEGQLVHAGDVLVTIDQRDYKIAVAQAQANLADAEATAASSHWNVPITSASTSSNLDSAQAAVVNAEAGVAGAEQNLESLKAVAEQAEANPQRAMPISSATGSS